MRTLSLIIVTLLIATASIAGKAITGNSNTFLNTYKVSQIDENKYLLSYENTSETFTIEVCPNEKECCYLVRSNQLEVMYLCNEQGFGLRKMPIKDQNLSTNEYCELVNCKAFKHQSLLTQKKKKTKEALGLIACFFPYVVNIESRDLVFNSGKEKIDPKLMVQD